MEPENWGWSNTNTFLFQTKEKLVNSVKIQKKGLEKNMFDKEDMLPIQNHRSNQAKWEITLFHPSRTDQLSMIWSNLL